MAQGHVYTPAKTMNYERDVAGCYLAAGGLAQSTYEGPVQIHIELERPIPSSWKKYRRANPGPCTVGQDIDNVAKSILDGLKGVAYKSDSQVDYLSVSKEWGPTWAAYVTLETDDGPE